MQITLGDVIGWIITIASAVGIAITVSIKVSIRNNSKTKKDNRKTKITDVVAGRDVTGGDKNGQ